MVWRCKTWDGEEEEEDESASGQVEAALPTCLHGIGGGPTATAEASAMATGEGSATDTGEPHIIPGYARGSRGFRDGCGPNKQPKGTEPLKHRLRGRLWINTGVVKPLLESSGTLCLW